MKKKRKFQNHGGKNLVAPFKPSRQETIFYLRVALLLETNENETTHIWTRIALTTTKNNCY